MINMVIAEHVNLFLAVAPTKFRWDYFQVHLRRIFTSFYPKMLMMMNFCQLNHGYLNPFTSFTTWPPPTTGGAVLQCECHCRRWRRRCPCVASGRWWMP